MIPAWLAVAASAESLSLEAALERALVMSEDLALVDTARANAEGQIWTARAGLLPTLNGSVSYQHQFSTQFDGVFGSASGPPGGSAPTGTGTPTATPTGATGGDAPVNPFTAKDTWVVGLQAQQGIYGGGRTGAAWTLAQLQRDLADLDADATRAAVVLTVASAYYDAVLADRLVEISASALEQAEVTLRNTQLAGEVGRISEFDVLRASVEVENQRVQLINAERTRVRVRLALGNLLNLPPDAIQTSEDLEDPAPVDEIALRVVGEVPAADRRTAIDRAEAGVTASEASLKLARANGLPSVGATGSLSFYGWSDDVLPPTEGWADAASVAVQVAVPIFNGGAVRGQVRSATSQVDGARTRLQQTEEAALADETDARQALAAAEAQWAATNGTVAQAERAYEIADVRFREGVSTQVELADARLLRQRALANRAQAARDLQVARTRLALLPLLPLR